MHIILRGFFFFCVIFVSRLSIYHEIAWPNLQHKTNAAFQTMLQKQDTWITTSKLGETFSFLINYLDSNSSNFRAI